MLTSRIIPCLLLQKNKLVKTKQFSHPKYVGDPINAVKIFNEKEVDELIILDIEASLYNCEPNYDLIEKLAYESRMPLCYGGGIKTCDQAQRIFSIGVEKIAVSSAAVLDIKFVSEIAEKVGRQSVVVVIDCKRQSHKQYEIWINNGRVKTNLNLIEFVTKLEDYGAGEIVINSIDNDGMMVGYDFDLVEIVLEQTSLPITVIGGAGSMNDIYNLISKFGLIGAAAGSLFVFKGRFRAVLINYPNSVEKSKILNLELKSNG